MSPVRGVFTFFGVAAAAFLLWLSTQFEGGTAGYWARIGVIAAAGLSLVLAQVFGGWTQAHDKHFADGAIFDKIYGVKASP